MKTLFWAVVLLGGLIDVLWLLSTLESPPLPARFRIYVTAAGRVHDGTRVLHDPNWSDDSVLAAHFDEVAERMRKAPFGPGTGPLLPDEPLAIVAHADAPTSAVAHVIALCAAKGRGIWRLRLSAVGGADLLEEEIDGFAPRPVDVSDCGDPLHLVSLDLDADSSGDAVEIDVERIGQDSDGATQWLWEVDLGRQRFSEEELEAAGRRLDRLTGSDLPSSVTLLHPEATSWQDTLALLRVLGWSNWEGMSLGVAGPPLAVQSE